MGAAAYRTAAAYRNDRPGNIAPVVYPTGFTPRQTLKPFDGALTMGRRGDKLRGGFSSDTSATYGHDSEDIDVEETINTGLCAAQGASPLAVHAGNPSTGQLILNADLRRPIGTGFPAALPNVAFGGEYRREAYPVRAGDPASSVPGGTQAYSGFTPTTVSDPGRNVYRPIRVSRPSRRAGRASTPPAATNISTAPTLGQINSSTTSIPPLGNGGQSCTIRLPLNSPGAAILNASPLKSGRSRNISGGIVLTPLMLRFHVNVDHDQIRLKDRIVDTGALTGALTGAPTLAAVANGNVTSAGSISTVKLFTNGVDTTTQGVDVGADYDILPNERGDLELFAVANHNHIRIDRPNTIPRSSGRSCPT